MIILFLNNKDRKLFEDTYALTKKHGPQLTRKIKNRLDDLRGVDCLDDMWNMPGHFHPLGGDKPMQFAVRLTANERLVFEPADDPLPIKPDGNLDLTKVVAIRILEVVDYHGK